MTVYLFKTDGDEVVGKNGIINRFEMGGSSVVLGPETCNIPNKYNQEY